MRWPFTPPKNPAKAPLCGRGYETLLTMQQVLRDSMRSDRCMVKVEVEEADGWMKLGREGGVRAQDNSTQDTARHDTSHHSVR